MSDQAVFNHGSTDECMLLGVSMRVLLTQAQTGGRFSVVEGVMPPGGDGGLHIHHREDESMIILEGSLSVTIGDETRTLGAGDSYFVPRGVPHRLRNLESIPMRSLQIATPGDFAGFVSDVAQIPAPTDPATPPSPAYFQALAGLLDRYGTEMLIPPGH